MLSPHISKLGRTIISLFSLALLDTYATPAYISADPVPFYGAPIRYLRTKGFISVVCVFSL